MSAHTPGPWIKRRGAGPKDGSWWIDGADGMSLGSVDDYALRGAAITEANATLIVAAPELLAALRALDADDSPSNHECARAALAKATTP